MKKYCVFGDKYTDDFLLEIKEKDNVIYDGKSDIAIRIIPDEDFFEILFERDGYLYSYDDPMIFRLHWLDSMIEQLGVAKNYVEKIRDKK